MSKLDKIVKAYSSFVDVYRHVYGTSVIPRSQRFEVLGILGRIESKLVTLYHEERTHG